MVKWIVEFSTGDLGMALSAVRQDRTRSNGVKLEEFKFRQEIRRHWFENIVKG